MKNRIKFKIRNIIFKLKAMYYIKTNNRINKRMNIMPIKQRGIGKTEFMVKYARNHRYTVVCSNYRRMRQLRQEYRYDKILTVDEIMKKGLRSMEIMIDEPVGITDIEKIAYETRHKIILAYGTVYNNNIKQLKGLF